MAEKLQILKNALGHYWTTGREHLFKCPKCTHHKLKMSVNFEKDAFKCWVCGYSGNKIYSLLAKHAPAYCADWREISGAVDITKYDSVFDPSLEGVVLREKVTLPDGFKTLTGRKTGIKEKPLKYLYSRGVDDTDILRWKMGFCDYGEYEKRVIIPSFDIGGNLSYYVGRTYTDNHYKYKNPQTSKDIIFNELNIDWSESIVLVEGVFDAVRCKNAIPLLGSSLHENSCLFHKICSQQPKVYLALDQDAQDKAFLIARKLMEHEVEVGIVDVYPFSDVGEMSKVEFEVRKLKADFMSNIDYLKYKLDF